MRGAASGNDVTTATTIIIGCGYVGERVARAEMERGAQVLAVTRNPERVAALQHRGIAALAGDLDRADTLANLPSNGALIYYFAPPPSAGRTDPRMAAFLDLLRQTGTPAAVVLISTTGIYGDCGGAWVTEARPPAPVADRALRRWDAEQRLTTWAGEQGMRVVILRVPGTYGPGRLPRARLQRGDPVLIESASPWSNRVHVDDLVHACLAAGARSEACGVFNISDGHPTTMTDYFNRAADALGLPRPPQIDPQSAKIALSAGMLSYLAESKRIDNRRMREQLGVAPRYQNLVEGLTASVREESAGGGGAAG